MSTPAETRFRIVLVSALVPGEGFTTAASPSSALVPLTPDTFDDVMARFAPTLTLELGRGPSSQTLSFALPRMRAFRPEWLVANVPALQKIQRTAPAPAPKSTSLLDDLLDAHESGSGLGPAVTTEVPSVLADVVSHPEFRRLEAAWRGAKHLIDAAGAKGAVTVELLHATRDGVHAALTALSPANAEGDAVNLVIVDHPLDATPASKDLAASWAEAGEALTAPVVVNGDVGWLGFDTLEQAGQTNRRVTQGDDARAVLFRSLASLDATRWLQVAVNAPLARPLHSKDTARENVVLTEREPLYLGPAVAVGALVARAVVKTGSPFLHVGPQHGQVSNLPVRMAANGGLATQAVVRTDVAAEAAKAGVALFASAPNTDFAVLTHSPVVYRGKSNASGTSRAAELTLADQLFISMAVKAVSTIAQAIPDDTPPASAREVALLSLAAALTIGGARPGLEVTVEGTPPRLTVALRPDALPGVSLPSLQLGARLGA
ncbi:MAG: type VI secretion system contractile sheath large subunit [Archangium sp.]|nr:type VI secretion system contractile sheath large subunit [Archangium sp.]